MTVSILLALHNGHSHLQAQLESLSAQTLSDWSLTVVDDGPDDGSAILVKQFERQIAQRVFYHRRATNGFAANFLSGLSVLPNTSAYIAFCDQDDIWLRDKLDRAVAALSSVPAHVPALYCSARWIWRRDDMSDLCSHHPYRGPSFDNALIENIAPGNTIVLNRAASHLAQETAEIAKGVFAHDWWLYQLISGVGGTVLYDPEPTLLYRQHATAVLGEGVGLKAKLRNKKDALRGLYRDRVTRHIDALMKVEHRLTPENRACLRRFQEARQETRPLHRALALARSGPKRQTVRSQASFLAGGIIGLV